MAKHRQRKTRRNSDFKHRLSTAPLESLQQNQLIFDALYRGLNAGMTPAASITVAINDVANSTAEKLVADLESGDSVTATITKNRLGSHFDHSLINIGETSGQLARTSQFIAERYARIIKHKQQLQSKLRMPMLVGFLAIVLLPLPDFVAGTIAPWRYFVAVLVSALLFLTAWRIIKYIFIKNSTAIDGYPAHPFIGLPLLDGLLTDYSRANFIERLYLLFASGYPIIEAVELSHNSLTGFARRMRYRDLAPDLHQGYSLADTFEHHEILSATQLPILTTGEAAGRLEESLKQIMDESRADVDRKIERFVIWFPRAIYATLTLILVSKII